MIAEKAPAEKTFCENSDVDSAAPRGTARTVHKGAADRDKPPLSSLSSASGTWRYVAWTSTRRHGSGSAAHGAHGASSSHRRFAFLKRTVSAVLPLASIPKKTKQLFVRLRKIANHPLLVRASYSEADMERIAHVCHKSGVFGFEASLDRVKAHLTEESYSDFDLHALCGDVATRGQLADLRLPERAFTDSGKTKYLLRLLHELKVKGSRPLIFSQWKIVLDVLEVALKAEGFPFVRLDGATATEERQKICDAYNAKDSSAFAFLLSTRAGGQGLNLTSADTVIIHDCDFNPQIDRQAEDRCHRLGQRRPVTVIRLVTRDSVDERIVAVAEKKLDLDAAILSDPKAVAAEENRAMHEIMEELLAG